MRPAALDHPEPAARPGAGEGRDSLATDEATIGRAFSAKAPEYDARMLDRPMDAWAREQVRAAVRRHLAPGGSILELNAGTGLDAAALAADGYRVHATDISPGMLERAERRAGEGAPFTVERRSFLDLDGIAGAPFDLVLSSFGGLNCTDRLDRVAGGIEAVLRPGGTAVLVFMPPIAPWEHVQIVRGDWRTATRRWRRDGVDANIGGTPVRTWYWSARTVEAAFGPAFRRRELRALCLFAPSLMLDGFPRRHATLTRLGMRLDEALGALPPFRLAGDFSILVLERRAGSADGR
jgi:ubiquinone/menaquinone biosynthesis C-methylase UbiE